MMSSQAGVNERKIDSSGKAQFEFEGHKVDKYGNSRIIAHPPTKKGKF